MLVVLALIVAIELRLSFFLISVSSLPTNTDEALNMLMARAISAGDRPLLFWAQPYQFPLEAYILSFFAEVLPHDAFGARAILAAIGSISFIGFWLTFRLIGSARDTWPGVALALVPSAYLLVRKSGYVIPQYTLTITFAWLLLFLFMLGRSGERKALWGVALGFFSGLALSVHLLSLSLVAMVAAAYCLGSSAQSARRNTLLFLPSFVIGLVPYIAAMALPQGYDKVADTIPFAEALGRVWNPLLLHILPGVMGFTPPTFPDVDYRAGAFAEYKTLLLGFFLFVSSAAVIVRGFRIARLLLSGAWPTLEIDDVCVGALCLTVGFAAFAEFGVRYRYILPLAWLFPFVVVSLYRASNVRIWRGAIGAGVCALLVVNYYNSKDLGREWSDPMFAEEIPALPPLEPLLVHLRDSGISRCYASWWLAYRIPYETNGEILCSQPINERFPNWPLPLRAEVDAAPDTPYILSHRDRGRYNPYNFQKNLEDRELEADRVTAGQWEVFSNFRHRTINRSQPLDSDELTVAVSENAHEADRLVDGNVHSAWTASKGGDGTHIHIKLDAPTDVHLLRLYLHDTEHPDEQKKLRVLAFDGTNWHQLYRASDGLMHRLKLSGVKEPFLGHPYVERVYGFPPIRAHALRIEHPERHSARAWRIGELEIFGPVDAGAS